MGRIVVSVILLLCVSTTPVGSRGSGTGRQKAAKDVLFYEDFESVSENEGDIAGWKIDFPDVVEHHKIRRMLGEVRLGKENFHSGKCSVGYYSRGYGKEDIEATIEFDARLYEQCVSPSLESFIAIPLSSELLEVERGKKYMVRAWVKADSIINFMIHFILFDKNKQPVQWTQRLLYAPGRKSIKKSGTWEWEEWGNEFEIPENVYYARIAYFVEEQTGKRAFWTDDILVRKGEN